MSICFLSRDTSSTAVPVDDPGPLSGVPVLRGDRQPRDGLLLDQPELDLLEAANDLEDRIDLQAEMLEAQAIRQAGRSLG